MNKRDPIDISEGSNYRALRDLTDKDGINVKKGSVLYYAARSNDLWRFHNKQGTHIICLINEYTARYSLEEIVNK